MVAALALLTACNALRHRSLPGDQSDPAGMVARADAMAQNGSPRAARDLYQQVVRKYPGTSAAADGLHGLGELYVDPRSPLHDYAAAHAAFARLANEHPASPHAPAARAWAAALEDLLRSQAEAKRLRADLDRLKELDIQQEQRR
jgi:TolA-binding protein